MVPELPNVGPCADPDGQPCKLSSHHFRQRKTGPCFPLMVMSCQPHKKAFTLYPPGHTPYGRKPLANVAEDGTEITGDQGDHRFQDTLFDAALDAAKGNFWFRRYGYDREKQKDTTQHCHLYRAQLILGIQSDMTEKQRETAGQILGVPGQLIHDSAILTTDNMDDIQIQGLAVQRILDAIPHDSSPFEHLVQAAYDTDVGLWSEPIFLDSATRTLRPSTFSMNRTRGPPVAK